MAVLKSKERLFSFLCPPAPIPSGYFCGPSNIVKSDNGIFALIMQQDGNLVFYIRDEITMQYVYPQWASDTAGKAAKYCEMQEDGNLVVYGFPPTEKDPHHPVLFASDTAGPKGAYVLNVQGDGNLVIYRVNPDGSFTPMWRKP
jgi:hypothetical protein